MKKFLLLTGFFSICLFFTGISVSAQGYMYSKIEACGLKDGHYSQDTDAVYDSLLEVKWDDSESPFISDFVKFKKTLVYIVNTYTGKNQENPTEWYLYEYNCTTKKAKLRSQWNSGKYGFDGFSGVYFADEKFIITYQMYYGDEKTYATGQREIFVQNRATGTTKRVTFSEMKGYNLLKTDISLPTVLEVSPTKNKKWKIVAVFGSLLDNPPKKTFYLDWEKQQISLTP